MFVEAISFDRVKRDAQRWAGRHGIKLGDVSEDPTTSDSFSVFRVPVRGKDGHQVSIIFQQDGGAPDMFSIGVEGAHGLRTSASYSTALQDLQITMGWIHAAINPQQLVDLRGATM